MCDESFFFFFVIAKFPNFFVLIKNCGVKDDEERELALLFEIDLYFLMG